MEKTRMVIDIGNTRASFGLYSRGVLAGVKHIASKPYPDSDSIFALCGELFAETGTTEDNVEAVAISSVVPGLTELIRRITEQHFSKTTFIIDANTDLGLQFLCEDPLTIGADLVINAFAAWKKYGGECIVCDFGTATTLQQVGPGGEFRGRIIAPGLQLSLAALIGAAERLIPIRPEKPTHLWGCNTRDAVLSGALMGHALMIDGFIERTCESRHHGALPTTIATGGLAQLILPLTRTLQLLDNDLTLDGLNLACDHLLAQC